ncbi:MAG: hypothetical protein JNK82_35930, partial [Myxococcaceae bacterium]|nr:hypothetical protein [Myxococcaceae bacterium]
MTFALLALALLARAEHEDEAARRFDAAVSRYNRGDLDGALAEFERVQELAPRAAVLFNIGMIQAALGRAAEAYTSFNAVLATPGSLSAERLARARAQLRALEPKLGRLKVRVRPSGATV